MEAKGAVGFLDEGKLLQPPDMLLRQVVAPAEAQRHAAKRDLFVGAERCEDTTHACPAAVRAGHCRKSPAPQGMNASGRRTFLGLDLRSSFAPAAGW